MKLHKDLPDIRTITFDPEPHTYIDEYQREYTSTTTLIGSLEKEYDSQFWAVYRCIDQNGSYKPRPFLEDRKIEIDFYGVRLKFHIDDIMNGVQGLSVTPDKILKEWDKLKEDACEWGSGKHDYLEDKINEFSKTSGTTPDELHDNANQQGYYYKVVSIEQLKNSPLANTYPRIFNYFVKLLTQGWILYAEIRLYHPDYLIAGMCDVVAVKGFDAIILDWKTNKWPMKFESGYFKKRWNANRTKKIKTGQWVKKPEYFNYPLNHIEACKGESYTMQLSTYAYMIECWGLNIKGILLCHIRPYLDDEDNVVLLSNGQRKEYEPKFYKLQYRREDVIRMFKYHKATLKEVV